MLRTYKDKEYPVKAMNISRLQAKIASLNIDQKVFLNSRFTHTIQNFVFRLLTQDLKMEASNATIIAVFHHI